MANFKNSSNHSVKDMQKEIKKYQGRIFYFDPQSKTIQKADWVACLSDYNHNELEAHHVIPYTQWEKNKKNIQIRYKNALILLPKIMHQHLENPIYKLTKEEFTNVYGINPDRILYNVNSKIPRTATLFIAENSENLAPCAEKSSSNCEIINSALNISHHCAHYFTQGISFEHESLFTDKELECFDSLVGAF